MTEPPSPSRPDGYIRPLTAPAVLAALAVLLLFLSGLATSTIALVVLAIMVQGATGMVWWAGVRGRGSNPAELLGAGLALGTLGAVLGAQILRSTPVSAAGWMLPSVSAIAAFAFPSFRNRIQGAVAGAALMSQREFGLGFLALTTGVLPIAVLWLQHPLSWRGLRSYNGDIEFHEALAASVSLLGPNEHILNLGGSVRYHWLAHGWIGAMTEWSSAEPFEVLTRVVPLVTLVGSGALAWSWARSVSNGLLAGPLAIVALVGAGEVGRLGTAGDHLSTLSPSQGLTTSWLLLAAITVSLILRAQVTPSLGAVLLALLAFGLMGGKVNHAAVLGGGIAASIVLSSAGSFVKRRARALVAGAALLGALAGYFTFIHGGDGGDFQIAMLSAVSVSDLAALPASLGLALGLMSLVATLAVRWSPAIGLRVGTSLPENRFLVGAVLAGMLVRLATSQAGGSQAFFTLSASALLAPFVGVGMSNLLAAGAPIPRKYVYRATLVGFAAAASVLAVLAVDATEVFGDLGYLGDTLQWMAPILFCALGAACWAMLGPVRRKPALLAVALFSASVASLQGAHAYGAVIAVTASDASVERGWSTEHVAAGNWLRNETTREDIVATNRLCKATDETPPACNSKSFLVAATSQRQVLIEGAQYSASVDGKVSKSAIDRMALASRFARTPNRDDLESLWELGVRWFWVDLTVGGAVDWDGFGTVEFENAAARIVRLQEASRD